MIEKEAPYALCFDVLKRLDKASVLGDLILVASEGFIRLVHPEFTIDFLVPWRGRHEGKPYPIKTLGINATPLRFVELLLLRQIHIRAEGLSLTLPHPACFAFQKLIISGRRQNESKRAKDRAQAFDVLDMVIHNSEQSVAKHIFQSLPPKWRKTILQELERGPVVPGSRVAELKNDLVSLSLKSK